jgi:uncharacterized protein with HEPN domain
LNSIDRDLSYPQFLADEKTQDAVIRNIEILGEAVKHLSVELTAAHPKVEWKSIAGIVTSSCMNTSA